MQVTVEEGRLFYKLFSALLGYVNRKLNVVPEQFGVGESTGAAKSKTIRTMLRIGQFDPKWTLPSRMGDNPLVWMLEVNGFVMDIRHAPRELQVAAFEKGLIPYIPADRAEAGEES